MASIIKSMNLINWQSWTVISDERCQGFFFCPDGRKKNSSFLGTTVVLMTDNVFLITVNTARIKSGLLNY